jgi:murein DD-endopeptidase MepM/ murein hydrolase activator NlpD
LKAQCAFHALFALTQPLGFLEAPVLTRPLLQTLAHAIDAASQSMARHPKRIMGGIGAILLGTGVTAFGIAPLAPDASDLPVSLVTEMLDVGGPQQSSLQLLPEVAGFALYRSDTVRRDDTAQSLLQRLGVPDSAAQAYLRSDSAARQLFDGRSGVKWVSVETNERHELQKLTARWLDSGDERSFERLTVTKNEQGYSTQREKGTLQASTRLSSGEIQSSLFAATDAANLPDALAIQLAELFSANIDFRRDLRKGDRFNLAYEVLEADGEPLGNGRILSAEFINNGRGYSAVWFGDGQQKGAYYSFDGESTRKEYLASPLQFTRVSSGYGMRFHPVYGSRRAHLGIDYAAPTGTPIRTIGDGVVSFAGQQRGYGNVVFITHRRQHTTVYAHMSRLNVRTGQRVAQGDTIGAVGCTGTCTGPHLHFEFRDKGVHMDPLVALRNSESVPLHPALRARFDEVAQAQRQKLDAANQYVQASAE